MQREFGSYGQRAYIPLLKDLSDQYMILQTPDKEN